MIECFIIEEFIITEMFRPYMSTLLPGDFQGLEYCKEQEKIERRLRKNPEYIIELMEEHPETKRLIFERLNRCDGVKFYRYLDMSCDVIQYIKSEMDRYKIPLVEMIKKLREMTGAGMMDCKRALEKNNYDISKASEYIKENSWKCGKCILRK